MTPLPRYLLFISLLAVFTAAKPVQDASDSLPAYPKRQAGDDRTPGVPFAIPSNATAAAAYWEPWLDFDTDSCYNIPFIDSSGDIVSDLVIEHDDPGDCRYRGDLYNRNVYVRERCDSGFCVYMYTYFFMQSDNGDDETVVPQVYRFKTIAVWVTGEDYGSQLIHTVALSTADGWHFASGPESEAVLLGGDPGVEGSHVKVVYHKEGDGHHGFRLATQDDDDEIENDAGNWIFDEGLLSWQYLPESVREILVFTAGFDLKFRYPEEDRSRTGFAIMPLSPAEDAFKDAIEETIPWEALDAGFDTSADDEWDWGFSSGASEQ